MSFTNLLAQTCRIERRSAGAADPQTGEWREGTWTLIQSDIPCRVSWSGGSETVAARSDARGQVRVARVFLDPGEYDIRRDDRLVVAEVAGMAFQVTFQKLVWASTDPHHWEVDVEVVEGT